MPEPLFKGRDW